LQHDHLPVANFLHQCLKHVLIAHGASKNCTYGLTIWGERGGLVPHVPLLTNGLALQSCCTVWCQM